MAPKPKLKPAPEPEVDLINPDHYQSTDEDAPQIECIDAIHAALGTAGFIAFLRGQVIKYNWRLDKKGSAHTDSQKAAWYQEKLNNVLANVSE